MTSSELTSDLKKKKKGKLELTWSDKVHLIINDWKVNESIHLWIPIDLVNLFALFSMHIHSFDHFPKKYLENGWISFNEDRSRIYFPGINNHEYALIASSFPLNPSPLSFPANAMRVKCHGSGAYTQIGLISNYLLANEPNTGPRHKKCGYTIYFDENGKTRLRKGGSLMMHRNRLRSDQKYREGTDIQIELKRNVVEFYTNGNKVESVDLLACGLEADELKVIEWHPFISAQISKKNSFSLEIPCNFSKNWYEKKKLEN